MSELVQAGLDRERQAHARRALARPHDAVRQPFAPREQLVQAQRRRREEEPRAQRRQHTLQRDQLPDVDDEGGREEGGTGDYEPDGAEPVAEGRVKR